MGVYLMPLCMHTSVLLMVRDWLENRERVSIFRSARGPLSVMEMFAPRWMRDLLRHRKHCLGIFGWPFLSGCSPCCSSSRPTGLPGFETRHEKYETGCTIARAPSPPLRPPVRARAGSLHLA